MLASLGSKVATGKSGPFIFIARLSLTGPMSVWWPFHLSVSVFNTGIEQCIVFDGLRWVLSLGQLLLERSNRHRKSLAVWMVRPQMPDNLGHIEQQAT